MQEKTTYNISQDFEIIPPKKSKVYPILVQELNFIKGKLKDIKININYFHTAGSVLIGSSLSFLATNLATAFQNPHAKIVCWAIFAITGIAGILSFIFGESRRKNYSTR